jgi:hypothetical protein
MPASDVRRISQLAGGHHDMWVVPDCGHLRAFKRHEAAYRLKVGGFFSAHLQETGEAAPAQAGGVAPPHSNSRKGSDQMNKHAVTMAIAGAALLLVGGARLGAQDRTPAADVSGVWQAAVVTDQGSGNPTFDLEQDGGTLSGTYRGLFGRSTVEGKLEGQEITITFKTWSPLNPLSKLLITYRGSVDPASMTMKGTVDFGGQGTGTWTAKRPKP